MSRPALLHNMSSPPRTVIQHQAAATPGCALLFQLPPGFRWAGPGGLLTRLTGRRWMRGAAQAEAELRRLLNEQAARLPLPPAALVAGSAEGAKAVEDLITVYTVLSKSSDRVYLRDKEPNLGRIAPERRVVLRLPPAQEEES